MIVPSPDRRATRRTFPGWTPFVAFAAEHIPLGRDAFLARLQVAHLLLWTPLVAEAADATFTTIMARPGRPPLDSYASTRRVASSGPEPAPSRATTPAVVRRSEPLAGLAELTASCPADDRSLPRGPRVACEGRTTPTGVAAVEKRAGANPFALMVTLGRAPNNDVVLNHPALSKFHAYLRRGDGGWVIDDAGSTNGTALDGLPVEKARGLSVRSGARITLGGEVELELLEPEDLWTRLSGA